MLAGPYANRLRMARTVNLQNIHQFAEDALASAERINLGADLCGDFSLPGLQLSVRTTNRTYMDHCRAAFGTLPPRSVGQDTAIAVSVVNRHACEDLDVALWDESRFSIGGMTEALQCEGYDGVFEFDYRLWQFLRHMDGTSIQLMQEDDAYPPWEESFPLRQFVHWAYQRSGRMLAHAGTLGTGGRGILLAGAGGAGKSGTVLAGVLNGLSTVGDDYISIDRRDGALIAEPVVGLMKQDDAGLERLGLTSLVPQLGAVNWQNKYVLDYGTLWPGSMAKALSLGAILLPRISQSERTEIRPVGGREALLALAPSSLYQLKGGWSETMKTAAIICRELPAFELRLGTDACEIADSLRGFMEEMSP